MTALISVNDFRKFVYYNEIIISRIPVSYTEIIIPQHAWNKER